MDPNLVSAKITKLQSRRETVWLQTLTFIDDRILGKPKQDVNVSCAFVHAEVRHPALLGWPSGGESHGVRLQERSIPAGCA